jgi:peptide-methionine (S)-S-oxide reductase
MQDMFRRLRGVVSTRVGYTGGDIANPSYGNHQGHAEAIEVVFDPAVVSYRPRACSAAMTSRNSLTIGIP